MSASLPLPEYRASHAYPGGMAQAGRIFVNRNLRMRSIGAVGFDLDYTLAHYRYREIDELAFRLTAEKLVEKRGHPKSLLDVALDPEFVVRGLVIDRRRGNILKMDYHNYVVRAYHGRRPLSDAERKKTYRSRRLRTGGDAYVSIDTLFHLPEAYLFLVLVDLCEAAGQKRDYRGLYQDVREMIDEAHADGSIKARIRADPDRFLAPDSKLAPFLDALRDAGKKVFLLTNSELYYADALLTHLLGTAVRPWRTYFDLVSVDARKPGFFLRHPGKGESVAVEGPGAPVRRGGQVLDLERALGFTGDAILYWGDHTYGDILRSKKSVGWRTAMIIPELEGELRVSERIAADLARLADAEEHRDRLAHDEQMARSELRRLEALLDRSSGSADEVRGQLVRKAAAVRDRADQLAREKERGHASVIALDDACSRAYNRYWGTLFREGNELSRLAHQVKDFACVYTARVSNFLHYPVNTYFRAPVQRLPHEL